MTEIPLRYIESNPYNSRSSYPFNAIERLTQSMRASGQLVPIKVRTHPNDRTKYQLVYGHRRVMAARGLGWQTINADIITMNDEEMVNYSLIENFEREDLSDYEKALIFERINREFGKTYDEIGKMLGISKQHVSNYIAMLRLFSPKELSDNPELRTAMGQISEHHARVLSRVEESTTRIDLAKLIVKDKLSVKDLTNMVGRLRSWFTIDVNGRVTSEQQQELDSGKSSSMNQQATFESLPQFLLQEAARPRNKRHRSESNGRLVEIAKVIVNEFRFAHNGDFESYKQNHLFGEGFSIYSAFPPFDIVEGADAMSKERHWFFDIAPYLKWQMKNLKINVFGKVALATLTISYSGRYLGRSLKMEIGGTVVLKEQKHRHWRIIHEHWSRIDGVKRRKGDENYHIPETKRRP